MGRKNKNKRENNNASGDQLNVEAPSSNFKEKNENKNTQNEVNISKNNENPGVDNAKSNNENQRDYRRKRYSNNRYWANNRRYYKRRYSDSRYHEHEDENGREANDNFSKAPNMGEEGYNTHADNRNNNFSRDGTCRRPYSRNWDNSWENVNRDSENPFRYERNDTYEYNRSWRNRPNPEHENCKEKTPTEEDNQKSRNESSEHKSSKSESEFNKLESTFETKGNEIGSNNCSKTDFSKEVNNEMDNMSNEKLGNKNLSKAAALNQKVKLEEKKTVAKPVLPLPSVKIKKEPHSHSDKNESSSDVDSSSSLATCSNDELKSTHKVKKNKEHNLKTNEKCENLVEEEIVYMGKLKNFENLIDEDESSNEAKKHCILCEKKGHTSFQCFMECKNCGEKYHNLKMCPKSANLSVMLQNFMEFCLQQCYQYDPEQKFTFIRDNLATELIPGLNQTRLLIDNISNSGSMFKNRGKRKRKKEYENVNEYDSDSESSSSSANVSKVKKKKKKDKMQYQLPFFPMTTPPFNPLAAAAMMGFSPAAFLGKKD
ncbi:probable serine/threonine-protein kinase clkA [Condylostylus longicornis]|uniref:probable serine/threonine-protein kinase clkA n=1 Tax=Condylostylus longicornis TaxID=2530218 RepID=UPI00244D9EE4|nr:probable serine/threonine-protein kinase clkA [Condylostylus longicornis]